VSLDDLGMRALEELTLRVVRRHARTSLDLQHWEREVAEALDDAMRGMARSSAADRDAGQTIAADLMRRSLQRIAGGSS
jgi:hypothetical protein